MSEVMKDLVAIKLFGKTISLPPDISASEQRQASSAASTSLDTKDVSGGTTNEDEPVEPAEETLTEADASSEISDDEPTTPGVEKKNSSSPETPNKEGQSESSGSQEKTLKKPDKILPCPRCNSMDTKFCYYNNYNVSQPRHFCKKCQRYWTAGGTMRNVPVGSGRRKTKSVPATNYGHIMVSEALQAVTQADAGLCFSSLKPNGFLLFGSDQSMSSTLNFEERSQKCAPNEFYELSSRSSCTDLNSSTRSSSGPAFGPSGFPFAFYPSTPYWGCAIPSSWNGPWAPPTSTLGKHSREENILTRPSNEGKENISDKRGSDRAVLVPKTLRIDDPNEAAKSSIWSAMGTKNAKIGSINGTSLFKAFEPKGVRNMSNIDNTQMALQANPAALSRSLNFHESA